MKRKEELTLTKPANIRFPIVLTMDSMFRLHCHIHTRIYYMYIYKRYTNVYNENVDENTRTD